MSRLTKIANALDAIALVADETPAASTAPDPFIEQLEARVGPLDPGVRQKLASDADYRRTFEKLTAQPEAPRSLGGPSEKSAGEAPRSKAERMRDAEEKFAAIVMGQG